MTADFVTNLLAGVFDKPLTMEQVVVERLEAAEEWARGMNRRRLEMLTDETFFYQIKDRRRKPWPTIRKLRRELGT